MRQRNGAARSVKGTWRNTGRSTAHNQSARAMKLICSMGAFVGCDLETSSFIAARCVSGL